ncbi:hypothetical protein Ddye_015853 [Dipteronia dyeriana]|uniref:Uncharacterized protein n=1 Tax=Dipteronia dyeriana TaxID=168575 RepID=A0AAD9U6N7_9ROSI|nr:hypothetical protein Ddye_015853 [Dipteronia dyeriana]
MEPIQIGSFGGVQLKKGCLNLFDHKGKTERLAHISRQFGLDSNGSGPDVISGGVRGIEQGGEVFTHNPSNPSLRILHTTLRIKKPGNRVILFPGGCSLMEIFYISVTCLEPISSRTLSNKPSTDCSRDLIVRMTPGFPHDL